MRVLVLNAGSSSLKFRVVDLHSSSDHSPNHEITKSSNIISPIGRRAVLQIAGQAMGERDISDHGAAVRWMLEQIQRTSIQAVGHRVVHGGERFTQPVLLTDTVVIALERLSDLAPLHNPPSLAAIQAARAVLGPQMPMVAVFDTAFHASMPVTGSTYAIPRDLAARHHIRRYGFHGIAHASLMGAYAAASGRAVETVKLVTLQLGNGCSAAAIRSGRSIDTSMGMTPLEGLMMGTRSGDLDPAIVGYLSRREGVEAATVEQWLNERSGLLGVSGLSNDVRDLLKAEREGHPGAALALDLFCYRVRKYIGAYLAVLNGADAVIFGGGIGEHASTIRARICAGMEWCGLHLDLRRNDDATGPEPGRAIRISADSAGVPAYVIGVDEEWAIAQETVTCLHAAEGSRIPL